MYIYCIYNVTFFGEVTLLLAVKLWGFCRNYVVLYFTYSRFIQSLKTLSLFENKAQCEQFDWAVWT